MSNNNRQEQRDVSEKPSPSTRSGSTLSQSVDLSIPGTNDAVKKMTGSGSTSGSLIQAEGGTLSFSVDNLASSGGSGRLNNPAEWHMLGTVRNPTPVREGVGKLSSTEVKPIIKDSVVIEENPTPPPAGEHPQRVVRDDGSIGSKGEAGSDGSIARRPPPTNETQKPDLKKGNDRDGNNRDINSEKPPGLGLEPTDKDRERVKEELKQAHDRIRNNYSESQNQIISNLQNALTGNDLGAFSSAMQAAANDPQFDKILKGVEANFQAAGTDLNLTRSGNAVIAHNNFSKHALQFNADGSASVRAVTRMGGDTIVQPGDVVSKDASTVFQAFSNRAVRESAPAKGVSESPSHAMEHSFDQGAKQKPMVNPGPISLYGNPVDTATTGANY